jgi:hypothetical protein
VRTILLQVATGQWCSLLQCAIPYHSKVCEAQGIEYKTVLKPSYQLKGQWERYSVIQALLPDLADGDLLIYLDDDCLVVGDLTTALPDDFDIGVVKCSPDVALRHGKRNVGAVWARVNERTRALYGAIVAAGPLPDPLAWHDQLVFNRELAKSDCRVFELDNRFNYMEGRSRSGPVVVWAWHGTELKRLKIMFPPLVKSLLLERYP